MSCCILTNKIALTMAAVYKNGGQQKVRIEQFYTVRIPLT